MIEKRTADVIIIGGGIMGCATAYRLAKRGVDVLVLEKKEIGNGGSCRNAGGVRQSARDPKELPLAMYAVKNIWPTLGEELGVNVEYHQGGNLRLGLTESDIKVLENHTAKSTKLGLDVKMISGDEAREICPYMSKDVIAASWCATDGHANPLTTTLGFYKKALELGVTFITGVHVNEIVKVKGRARKVITDDGVYEADNILLCAGYESRRIANTVGIDAPVERQFNEVLVTEAQPKMFDVMIGVAGGEFYGHQSEHGSFVLGGNSGLQAFTSNNDNFVTNSLTAPSISRGIIKYFPVLKNCKVVRTWSGWYDQCIDVLPVIDNVKEVPGLTLGFGFSGHGFGISPAVSIALSELILDGESKTIDISQLKYDRFKPKK
ncbi:MAG: FAD-binding oxidoreductase [Oscillospiraceae bacterium]|nr:FAD-binding oxidoreductase [Oscillospiraceae bacterium]MDD6084904.1 FAD-binding oxidoreductase [Oscillospiraceae bacterium]MDY3257387.1 FAD-binding oxidoreductase [Ruminococcus callidus]